MSFSSSSLASPDDVEQDNVYVTRKEKSPNQSDFSTSDKEETSDVEPHTLVTQKQVFGSDTDSGDEVSVHKGGVEQGSRESTEPKRYARSENQPRRLNVLPDTSSDSESDGHNEMDDPHHKHSHTRQNEPASEGDDEEQDEDEGSADLASYRTSSKVRKTVSPDEVLEEDDEDSDRQDVADEAADATPEELDEARIAVDFPLIRADLGKEMHLVKMPNFLSVETRPFDPAFYEDELDEDEILDEEGRTRLKLKVENTIRWRFTKTPSGDVHHESNARIVRWSDGSLSLHLGDEIFDIHKVDIQSDYNYLFIREGSGLQGQSSLKTKLTFRPHSTDSFTHRKITLSLADKTNKSQKVKILPVAGADPECNRNVLVRKEEEKLRASLRRESQLRRMREKQAMSRSSIGASSSGRRSYSATMDDDEDDDHTTSLNAIKRSAKTGFAAGRKDVSAIYSSDSESLSDLSEPTMRKKIRAQISDGEESA